MKSSIGLKAVAGAVLTWLGASLAFVVSLVVVSLAFPMLPSILAHQPASGFLAPGLAMLFNASANGLVLAWAGRRSSMKGLALWAQLVALSFGAQVFLTQVETAYFISAFPLLHGNFEVYNIVWRGLLVSAFTTLAVTVMVGGFSSRPREGKAFSVTAAGALRAGAWLAAVYVVLYFLFGYAVAWQSQEVRLFYAGPSELNSFADQMLQTLMGRPEILVFQYMRGVLWILCLIPLFLGFAGKRLELVVLSALAFALLPSAQLAFANPLMPAGVSLAHFWEVSISTGIFGALCAWFVPKRLSAASS
jgi:hypothetical protein